MAYQDEHHDLGDVFFFAKWHGVGNFVDTGLVERIIYYSFPYRLSFFYPMSWTPLFARLNTIKAKLLVHNQGLSSTTISAFSSAPGINSDEVSSNAQQVSRASLKT